MASLCYIYLFSRFMADHKQNEQNHILPFSKMTVVAFMLSTLMIISTNNNLFSNTVTSVISGNYSSTAIWDGGVVPVLTDTVVIANGDTVRLTGNTTLRYLVINSGGVLDNMGSRLTIDEAGGTGTLFTINGVYTGDGATFFYIYSTSSVLNHINGTGTVSTANDSYWLFQGSGGVSRAQIDTGANLTFNISPSGNGYIATGGSATKVKIYCYGTISFVTGSLHVGSLWTQDGELTIGNTGQLSLTSGDIKMGTGSYIYNYGIATIGGSVVTDNASNYWQNRVGSILNIAGVFFLKNGIGTAGTGSLRADYSGNTINYNGAGNQTIIKPGLPFPGYNYWNLKCANSGVKTLAANTIINGDLTVQDAAQMDVSASSYSVTLKGNWSNTSTHADPFAEQTGTVTLSGTGVQTISSSTTAGETFYKLTINNTYPGDTMLLMNDSVNISNTLTLTDGVIVLNSNLLTITNPATTAIIGGSSSSYIKSETNSAINPGIVQWNMGTSTGAHVFPFGKPGYYLPFTFDKLGAVNANISVSTRATNASNNLPWAGQSSVAAVGNMSNDLTDISETSVIDRWWDISSSVNPLTDGADITFSYAGDENTTTTPESIFKPQHWNGTTWDAPAGAGNIGVTTGVGIVNISAATTFSPWVLADAGQVPLPIELLSFKALCTTNVVELKWTTATETNNDYFTIERTLDGVNFEMLGKITATGNSNQITNYSFVDSTPFSFGQEQRVRYYRLKQVDFDGQWEAFNFISCLCNTKELFTPLIYPTLASDNINIEFCFAENVDITLQIFDDTGRLRHREIIAASKNAQTIKSIKIHELNAGMYYLQLISGENRIIKKFIKR